MSELKSELKKQQIKLGLIPKIYCDGDETVTFNNLLAKRQPLPKGVWRDDTGYYRCGEPDFSENEIRQLLLFRQIQYLRTIKNCAVYFVVLLIVVLFILLAKGVL